MRRKNSSLRFIVVLVNLALLLSSCGSKPEPASESEPTLFQAAVSIEDGEISPKAADFYTVKKQVMGLFLHINSTVFSNETDVIGRDIVIDGVAWRELFTFYEDMLIGVRYVMRPETQEEYWAIRERLLDDADAYMPAEMLMNANDIHRSRTAFWRDETGNRVTLSFSDDVPPGVSLQIWKEPTVELWEKLHPGEPLPPALRDRPSRKPD